MAKPSHKAAPSAGKTAKKTSESAVRQLRPSDLDAVVTIDRQDMARARRGYFEKRLDAVQRSPDSFVTLGLDASGQLKGYVIARISRGEFGRESGHAVLDSIGVDHDSRGKGFGRALMAGLDDELKRIGISELFSQADWSNRSLLDFFATAGFELAPVALLERSADDPMSFEQGETR